MSYIQVGYGQLTQGLGNLYQNSAFLPDDFRISVIGVSVTDVGRIGEVEIGNIDALGTSAISATYARVRHLSAIPIGVALNSNTARLITTMLGTVKGTTVSTNIVNSRLRFQSNVVATATSKAQFSGAIFFTSRVVAISEVDTNSNRRRGLDASAVATSIVVDTYNRRRLYTSGVISDGISSAVSSGRFTFSVISIAQAIVEGRTAGIVRNTSASVIGLGYVAFELPEIPPLIIIGGDVKERFLGNALKTNSFLEPSPQIPIKPFKKVDKFTEPKPNKRPLGPPTTDTHDPP